MRTWGWGLMQVDPEEDPVLARALAGTLREEWRPAADALASARGWERRAYVLLTLATTAARHAEWLRNWLRARPDDRDAKAVQCAIESLNGTRQP